MNIIETTILAFTDAINNGTHIAVYHCPIAEAEEEGNYGYCPVQSLSLMAPHGTHISTIHPEGYATDITEPQSIK